MYNRVKTVSISGPNENADEKLRKRQEKRSGSKTVNSRSGSQPTVNSR